MTGKILMVDDEKDMLTLLKRIVTENTAHAVTTESDALKALEIFKADHFDLVFTDLKMPGLDGISLLEKIKNSRPETAVVVMTAFASIETAVDATRKGAYDYITKPFRRERILLTIEKVMEWQKMLSENRALKKALATQGGASPLIGSSPAMKEIFDRIRQVAPTGATVLITGPSGTGKELVARCIHHNSLRKSKNLITVNCTALPEQVIESELFGHVKGAFTGAWKDKKGLVEQAHGGTLFLDEIGDLSPSLQTKLLRMLQEGEYKPVGAEVTRKADIRFIAATNHELKADIKNGSFREDLFYRLNVIHFKLPPLRERKADIPLLSLHFLQKYSQAYGKDIREISPSAMQALAAQEFPGNVRELENIVERAVVFCQTDTLKVKDLFLESDQGPCFPDMPGDLFHLSFREAKEKMIQMFHAQYIQGLLRESGGNISKAADMAGIQRQYLHRLMKEADISAEEFREGATQPPERT